MRLPSLITGAVLAAAMTLGLAGVPANAAAVPAAPPSATAAAAMTSAAPAFVGVSRVPLAPRVVTCGDIAYTWCVVLSRTNSRKLANASVGVTAGAAIICGAIPNKPYPLLILKATCGGLVAAKYANVRSAAATAKRNGTCVAVRVPKHLPVINSFTTRKC